MKELNYTLLLLLFAGILILIVYLYDKAMKEKEELCACKLENERKQILEPSLN